MPAVSYSQLNVYAEMCVLHLIKTEFQYSEQVLLLLLFWKILKKLACSEHYF